MMPRIETKLAFSNVLLATHMISIDSHLQLTKFFHSLMHARSADEELDCVTMTYTLMIIILAGCRQRAVECARPAHQECSAGCRR